MIYTNLSEPTIILETRVYTLINRNPSSQCTLVYIVPEFQYVDEAQDAYQSKCSRNVELNVKMV